MACSAEKVRVKYSCDRRTAGVYCYVKRVTELGFTGSACRRKQRTDFTYNEKGREAYQIFNQLFEEGWVYDYSVPIENIIPWVGGNYSYHKLLEKRMYEGVGMDWDYNTDRYYYTDIIPDIVAQQNVRNDIFVYPNPVVDVLYVRAGSEVSVKVYNLHGEKIIETNDKQIDMCRLPQGIYIGCSYENNEEIIGKIP